MDCWQYLGQVIWQVFVKFSAMGFNIAHQFRVEVNFRLYLHHVIHSSCDIVRVVILNTMLIDSDPKISGFIETRGS